MTFIFIWKNGHPFIKGGRPPATSDHLWMVESCANIVTYAETKPLNNHVYRSYTLHILSSLSCLTHTSTHTHPHTQPLNLGLRWQTAASGSGSNGSGPPWSQCSENSYMTFLLSVCVAIEDLYNFEQANWHILCVCVCMCVCLCLLFLEFPEGRVF